MPPAFDQDLNRILSRARELLDEEDLQALRGLVEKLAAQAQAVLAAPANEALAPAAAAEGLAGLSRELGLESRDQFRKLDVLGFLRAVDTTLFRRLAATDSVRSVLSGVDVRLEAEEGEWARLRFVATAAGSGPAPAGGPEEDVVEVVRHDGKWVLLGWSVSWPKQMASLEAWVEGLAARKKEDPQAFRKDVRAWSAAVEGLGTLLGPFLRKAASSR
jgi:hypothetical protein